MPSTLTLTLKLTLTTCHLRLEAQVGVVEQGVAAALVLAHDDLALLAARVAILRQLVDQTDAHLPWEMSEMWGDRGRWREIQGGIGRSARRAPCGAMRTRTRTVNPNP